MKKVIAIAVAGALMSPLALAEVTLKGRVGVEFTSKSFEDKDKKTQNDLGNWGTRVQLSGSQQAGESAKLDWLVTQNLNWATGSGSVGDTYLNFSGDFGALRFGRFGRFSPGVGAFLGLGDGSGSSTNRIIRYTTPNFTGDNDQRVTLALSFDHKGGEKVAEGSKETPGHAYFLHADYNGKLADSSRLRFSYVLGRITESNRLDKKEGEEDLKEEIKDNVKGFFSGPKSHYLAASYATAKAADNSNFTSALIIKSSDGVLKSGLYNPKKANADNSKYIYGSQLEYGISLGYDTGDLGLTPSVGFAVGEDIKFDRQKMKDTGYMAYNIQTGYKVSKNISTEVEFSVRDPKGRNNRESTFRVGLRTTF